MTRHLAMRPLAKAFSICSTSVLSAFSRSIRLLMACKCARASASTFVHERWGCSACGCLARRRIMNWCWAYPVEIMGVIGIMALAANTASVLLLMRYKDGDVNVRSVWLCSRNDAIGDIAVMGAALAVR